MASATFTFHGSDTDDSFQCSLDGSPWATCSSPQIYTSLADGTHTFQVRAVDAVSEVDATPASHSFIVEATPPTTTITSAPSGHTPLGPVSIMFRVDEAGSTFRCSLDGASYSPCNSPYEISKSTPGPHSLKVLAANMVGVSETTPATASWSSVEPEHSLCGTLANNTTVGPDYAERYVLTCSVNVPEHIILTIEPGTIVKAYNSELKVEGALDAVGTESEPITFTSTNDNSTGGNTGNGEPKAYDWDGIVTDGGGSIELEHANLSYARDGVEAWGSGATVVKDDAFAFSASQAVEVRGGTPTVEDNSSTNVGDRAFVIISGAINASLLGGNTASGTGSNVVDLVGTVSVSSTLSAGGAAWMIGLPQQPGALVIPEGVTLTIAPGTVVKAHGGSNTYGEAACGNLECSIYVQGTLHATGTTSEPITFTSTNDNSTGGNTGNGEPKAQDWAGIAVSGEGTLNLERAYLRYAGITFGGKVATISDVSIEHAEQALEVLSGAVSYRGTFSEDVRDVASCDWGSSCAVDASYTYWGSTSGPFPPEAHPLVCGSVTTSPWYTSSYRGSSTTTGSLFAGGNCDGSSTLDQQLATASASAGAAEARETIQCDDGFQEACEVIKQYEQCFTAALDAVQGKSSIDIVDTPSDAASKAGDFLSTSAVEQISDVGDTLSAVGQILSVASTLVGLNEAYAMCFG